MSQSTQKSGATSSDIPQAAFINTAEYLVGEFERLLASELHLLENGKVDGLEAIADAKQTIVDQLTGIEKELIGLFEQQPQSAVAIDLKGRLGQCRVDNQNNHALVMLELKHSNKSLELLRSVLNMDDLSLYSESGEMHINREKRKFGSA